MAKRGVKSKGKVKIEWSSNFAYAIGLLATDGCLRKDKCIISFGSKDMEQMNNFVACLALNNKIGENISGYKKSISYHVQFGDTIFWNYLVSIGIGPAKSKTLGKIEVPQKYFFDFLRGCFDGDGSIHSYWDTRWKSSFMYYLSFCSASKSFILWLQSQIMLYANCTGHITKARGSSVFQLKYAKRESGVIIENMYYSPTVISLSRKRLKISKILDIVSKKLL